MTNQTIENRYLSTWHYNAALILTELETIVKNNGGALCRTWEYSNPPTWLTDRKQYLIVNRALTEATNKEKELLTRLEKLGRTDAARETREKLAKYESINNAPVLCYYADYLYIDFVVDGHFYSYSMDRNPFFEFHFVRIRIEEGNKINRNYYLQDDPKQWLYDCFFYVDCSASDRREAANMIYNMLTTANNNRTYHEKNRKPFSNIILIED